MSHQGTGIGGVQNLVHFHPVHIFDTEVTPQQIVEIDLAVQIFVEEAVFDVDHGIATAEVGLLGIVDGVDQNVARNSATSVAKPECMGNLEVDNVGWDIVDVREVGLIGL